MDNKPIAVSDVLADKNHPAHAVIIDTLTKLQSGEISMCGCMGKQGEDPYCPCEMRRRGLEPTNAWTSEKTKEFENVLKEIYKL